MAIIMKISSHCHVCRIYGRFFLLENRSGLQVQMSGYRVWGCGYGQSSSPTQMGTLGTTILNSTSLFSFCYTFTASPSCSLKSSFVTFSPMALAWEVYSLFYVTRLLCWFPFVLFYLCLPSSVTQSNTWWLASDNILSRSFKVFLCASLKRSLLFLS